MRTALERWSWRVVWQSADGVYHSRSMPSEGAALLLRRMLLERAAAGGPEPPVSPVRIESGVDQGRRAA